MSRTSVHTRYKTSDGKTVPSVTSVLKLLDKPQLVEWAHRLGLEGRDMKTESTIATTVGTIAHAMAEAHQNGKELDLSCYSLVDQVAATACFRHFNNYWTTQGFKPYKQETKIVSERYRYGGTLDCICHDQAGNLTLLDFKTSKRVYDEYAIQLSAYQELWNEANPDNPIKRRLIVRIGKQGVLDFEVVEYGDLSNHFAVFTALIKVYEALEKICK